MPEHTPAPTPARSLYGFFMYLFSRTALFIYLIWAFIPDKYLHYVNIYYYPDKYWATAIPIQCLVALTLFAFVIYPTSNLLLTAEIDSISTIKDSYSIYEPKVPELDVNCDICVCKDKAKLCLKQEYNSQPADDNDNTIPPIRDLDIKFVSRLLYNMNRQNLY